MVETILVTGASGFLGSALVSSLVNNGFRVIGIGRNEYGLLNKDVINNDNFTFVKTQTDSNTSGLLADFNINGIIHLASQLGYSNDLGYDDYYNGNVNTTRAVIKLSKEKNIKYVIFGSTCSMYGRSPLNGNINENVLPDPTDNYGFTKYIAEKLLEIELQFVPTKVFVLRFTSIYGMNDRYGIVNTFPTMAKQNNDIKLFGNGKKLRNLLHLPDAVELIIKSIEKVDKLGKHEIFIAGGQHSIKVFDLATKLIKLINSNSKIILAEERTRVDWDPLIDISKANRILGFSPISVSEGLKQYALELS